MQTLLLKKLCLCIRWIVDFNTVFYWSLFTFKIPIKFKKFQKKKYFFYIEMMGMSKFVLIEYQIIYYNLEINLSIYDVREPTND